MQYQEVKWNKIKTNDKVLYKHFPFNSIMEGVIEKISPSRKYVKIDGTWYESKKITILEVLE